MLTDPIPPPSGVTSQSPRVPRTHLMFSHTIKGQLYNTELLSKFLSSDVSQSATPRLIDYELLTGDDGKRTVGFGWFAGGRWQVIIYFPLGCIICSLLVEGLLARSDNHRDNDFSFYLTSSSFHLTSLFSIHSCYYPFSCGGT